MLTFLDITIAFIIRREMAEKGKPPTQRQLLEPGAYVEAPKGVINDFLNEQQVPTSMTPFITSNQRLATALKRLREANLIDARGAYAPTIEMEMLFARLGTSWQMWPIEIPVTDGKIQFTQAEYRRKVRGYREKRQHDEPR